MLEKTTMFANDEVLDLEKLFDENPQDYTTNTSTRGSSNAVEMSVVNANFHCELTGQVREDGTAAMNGMRTEFTTLIMGSIIPEDSIVIEDVKRKVKNKETGEESIKEYKRRMSTIQVMKLDNNLIVSHFIKSSAPTFRINIDNGLAYKRELTDWITQTFNLDFTDTVALRFKGRLQANKNGKCAVIDMSNPITRKKSEKKQEQNTPIADEKSVVTMEGGEQ